MEQNAVTTINQLAHGSESFVVNTEAVLSAPHHSIVRRNRPGTKATDWCQWPVLSFDEMSSPLAVQQLVQEVVRAQPHDADALLNAPDESGIDEQVWKYECLRQFCLELNILSAKLQTECNPSVCPQMSATDQWQFLCASHKQPKECAAIDYIRHTLDGAAAIMNSSKYFPSRVNVKDTSVTKLGSICRRVYRIFSHAFFNHRELFDKFEAETSLCRRFTRFVIHHQLVTPDSIIIPADE